jgi:hypothetical protein
METSKLFTDANVDSINELLTLEYEYNSSISFCKVLAIAFESIHKVPYNALSERSYELLYGTINLNFIGYLSNSKFYKVINWDLVSKSIPINFQSEKDCWFVVDNSDKINWDLIWKHQIVPEDEIKCWYSNSNGEFDDIKFNWDLISEHQQLSNKFLAKYADKINWKILVESNNIPYFEFNKGYEKEVLENNYREPMQNDFVNPDDFNILMAFKPYTNIKNIVSISVFS